MNQELLQALVQLPKVVSICLIGSVTRKFPLDASDLDVLLLTDGVLHKEDILIDIKTTCPDVTAEVLDDIIRITGFEVPISIAIIRKEQLLATISNIIKGELELPQYRPWAILGYVPEVICADILDCVILYEKDNSITSLKKMLDVYPSGLRKTILAQSVDELLLKKQIADRSLRNKDLITCNLAIVSSLLSLVRALYAVKEIYFRGMKHLGPQLNLYIPEHLQLIECIAIDGACTLEQKISMLDKITSKLMTLSQETK